MRIPWPIMIVAVLVTAAIYTIGIILNTVQTVTAPTAGPAPSWWDFIASNAPRVALPTLVVGVIAWIVERNIQRRMTTEHRGFDVVHRDDKGPPAA